MTELFRTFCITRGLGFLFLIFLLLGCFSNGGAQDEVPITTQSDEARGLFLEGLDLFDKWRRDEARELFAKAVDKDPDFATAHLYQAVVASSTVEFQKHLSRAVELADNVSEGERLVIEAVQAGSNTNLVKEVQLREQLAQKYPKDKRMQWYLGRFYNRQDKDDKAIEQYRKVLDIDNNFAIVHGNLGYAFRKQGKYEESETAFKNYIRLLPDEADPYDSIGDLYTKIGRYEDAIKNYKKSVELNPKFWFSQLKIGTSLVFTGKYDEGREAYRQAIEMSQTPSQKVTDMNYIAYSHLYEDNYKQALSALGNSLKMAADAGLPERIGGIHTQKCRIYLESGDLKSAEQSLAECRKAVMASDLRQSVKENFAKGTILQEALIAAKRKDFETAMAKAEEYKTKIEAGNNPKEMEANHALVGQIYLEKGDYGKAIEHLKQANQMNPYSLYLLAVAQAEIANKAEAAVLFKKVAHWNENSLNYALVRNKAMTAMKKDVTEK